MALSPVKLSAEEEAQLTQTVEMFEVITQGQPQDYQSLEILKELKLNSKQELQHSRNPIHWHSTANYLHYKPMPELQWEL